MALTATCFTVGLFFDTLWVVSLGTHDGDDHLGTTGSAEAAGVHPDITKALTIVAVCQPVLASIRLDLYNYEYIAE
jgi:hypothetical protein